jgi:hypothetical protein
MEWHRQASNWPFETSSPYTGRSILNGGDTPVNQGLKAAPMATWQLPLWQRYTIVQQLADTPNVISDPACYCWCLLPSFR